MVKTLSVAPLVRDSCEVEWLPDEHVLVLLGVGMQHVTEAVLA